MAARARPCAARTRLFGLINTPNGPLRAPRPSQLCCSPKNKKIFQKHNASFLARTRAARGVYLSTGLSFTLLSYIAPSWSTLHPPELRCTLMSHSAPYWATLQPTKLYCIHLSYAAHPAWAKLRPSELSCTLLSYAAPFWATLHPSEFRCTLSDLASPYAACSLWISWALLSYATALWATLHPSELRCTLLRYTSP